MNKLHFLIEISADREKVWDIMLNKESYKEWTEAFSAGSYYEGRWDKGSKILFLGPSENGSINGMVSFIEENRKPEFLSIKHLGMVTNGVEDTESDSVKEWAGAHENYTFIEKDGKTELHIDIDTDEKYKDMFEEMWPRALQRLKSIVENN